MKLDEKPRRRSASLSIEEIVQSLRHQIATHQIPPGSQLKEQELAAEFSAPRTRIREAFSVLEQKGLITRVRHRGAVVLRLDLATAFEIYEVREVLEGFCVRLATEKTPPKNWEEFARLFGPKMERNLKRGDREAYISAVDSFRQRFIEASSNAVVKEMLESINDRVRTINRRIALLPGRAELGLKEHRAIIAAMRKGDSTAAERLKRENIQSAREYLGRYEDFVL